MLPADNVYILMKGMKKAHVSVRLYFSLHERIIVLDSSKKPTLVIEK